MSEVHYVQWKIEGEYITELARHWFWKENKGYEKVEELIESLITDDVPKEVIREITLDIIEGRKKLVGVNSFSLEDDYENTQYLAEYIVKKDAELAEANKSLKAALDKIEEYEESFTRINKKLQSMINECEKKKEDDGLNIIRERLGHSNFIDAFSMNLYGITGEMMRRFCEMYNLTSKRRDWGFCTMYMFEDSNGKLLSGDDLIALGAALKEESSSPSDDSSYEISKDNQPWGWLSPKGEFWKGDFGEHEEVAYDIISKKGWEDEFDDWERGTVRLGRDFLARVKGYVLLHNPTGQSYTIVSHEKPLTKAQKEFLYDYFMKEGDTYRANSYFQD